MISLSKPIIEIEETEAILEVLRSGQLAQGPKVYALEEAFAKTVGTKHAVAVSSGTAALHLALLAHGIGPGDEVITPGMSFIASASSIVFAGARPVFADVLPDYTIDPDDVVAKLTNRTKAVICVHLYGLPCELVRLGDICAGLGIPLIEDCAQAIGAKFCGHSVGSFGTGCFSLYATKNIMSAEGGMVTTDQDHIAARVRSLRAHGYTDKPYMHDRVGYNYRMTDLSGALALAQLAKLDRFTTRRRHIADRYDRAFDDDWNTPQTDIRRLHCYHQYTLRAGDLDAGRRTNVLKQLKDAGIATGMFYPLPLHKQPAFRSYTDRTSLRFSELFCDEVFQIPVHPALTDAEVDYIITTVRGLS